MSDQMNVIFRRDDLIFGITICDKLEFQLNEYHERKYVDNYNYSLWLLSNGKLARVEHEP